MTQADSVGGELDISIVLAVDATYHDKRLAAAAMASLAPTDASWRAAANAGAVLTPGLTMNSAAALEACRT
jgi:hypothetical protein